MTTPASSKRMKKHLWILCGVVIGMFAFCFALVPIYSVFCQVTGLNGKTGGKVQPLITKVDTSRTVTVELLATLNSSLPAQKGEFAATNQKVQLHPGEYVTTSYWVKNLSGQPMVVQAIPSVTPGLAATHIKKIECFCFQKQPLDVDQGQEMRLVFTVDPALPTSIKTITLAYTLFDVTQR